MKFKLWGPPDAGKYAETIWVNPDLIEIIEPRREKWRDEDTTSQEGVFATLRLTSGFAVETGENFDHAVCVMENHRK